MEERKSFQMISGHRADFAIGAAMTALFAWWVCFSSPSITHTIDYTAIFQPHYSFAFDAIKSGTVPLWNPYSGLGRPLLSDIHLGLLYPPTYLLLLGESPGLFLLIWLHAFILWAGIRQAALHFGANRSAALLAGLVAILSGFCTARLMSGAIFYVFQESYAPWLLLFTARLGRRWNWTGVLLLAFGMTAMFLCGNGHVFWILQCGIGMFLFFSIPSGHHQEHLAARFETAHAMDCRRRALRRPYGFCLASLSRSHCQWQPQRGFLCLCGYHVIESTHPLYALFRNCG